MRYEGSMLASLISGKWKEGDGEGEIFIVRDGARFNYVLDYLRSDHVLLPDPSSQIALTSEFEYFGISADMKNIIVQDDFMIINELAKKIKRYEASIEDKKKKIAAIKESSRVAGLFWSSADAEKQILAFSVDKDVDKSKLTVHLQGRGLHVLNYINGARAVTANLCVVSMKEQLAPSAT